MTYAHNFIAIISALMLGAIALLALPGQASALSHIDWNYPYTRSSTNYVVTSSKYGNQYNNWNWNTNSGWNSGWNTNWNWNNNWNNGYTVTIPDNYYYNTPATYTYYDYYEPYWYYTEPVTYYYDGYPYYPNSCWNCSSYYYPNNGWGVNFNGYYSNSWSI